MTRIPAPTRKVTCLVNMWLAAWFYSILLSLSENIELNPGAKRNSSSKFSICHWNLNSKSAHNMPHHFSLRLILPFTSFILFVYQKHTLFLHLMIAIWKFLCATYCVKITLLTTNKALFLVITKTFYLYVFSMSNISTKVSVLRLKLVIKLASLHLSTYPQTKVRVTLRASLKTLN